MNITQKDMDRFWSKVDKERSDVFYNGERCWEWTAFCNPLGYGIFGVSKKTELSHRVAWVIANGEIPISLLVCHHCDNPHCVNPAHLFLGTNQDNVNDRVLKGRGNALRGDKHWLHLHPEKRAWGERNGRHTHPESTARGDRSGARLHPEKLARGLQNGKYTHPEKIRVGEDHAMAKLTWEQVRDIRRRYKWMGIGGESANTLSKLFGVTKQNILLIVNNKIWIE